MPFNFGDEDLCALSKISRLRKSLQVLHLDKIPASEIGNETAANSITDWGLQHLSRFTALRAFSVENQYLLTDTGLQSLLSAPKTRRTSQRFNPRILTSLNMCNSSISYLGLNAVRVLRGVQ